MEETDEKEKTKFRNDGCRISRSVRTKKNDGKISGLVINGFSTATSRNSSVCGKLHIGIKD